MIWTDKFKFMGPCTLDDEERGGGDTEEGVIVMDVSNVNMIEGMAKTLSEMLSEPLYSSAPNVL